MKVTLPPLLLLCGGLGSRLRAVVSDRPKPLAQVQDRPFLDHLLDWYRAQGVTQFILAAGYLGEQIRAHYAHHADVEVVIESEPLGTAGAIRFAWSRHPSSLLLVANGDSVCPLEVSTLVRRQLEGEALATLAVSELDASADYGRVVLSPSGFIEAFLEKSFPETPRMFINAGVYCFDGAVQALLPERGSLETEVFPRLAQAGQLAAVLTTASVLDIGTPERLRQAQNVLTSWMVGAVI